MSQSFVVSGTVTVTDTGAVTFNGQVEGGPLPPIPPTPPVGDQIDLSQAVITAQSPDVRGWPIGAKLSSLGLSASSTATLDFSKRYGPGAWPFVNGPEGGEIQYTLWVGCKIGGIWYLTGSILCISRGQDDNYVPTGPTLQPGQLPGNWYYYAGSPLASYQPQPGEQVAWFLTSGVQRRNDIHQIAERTQVVLTPFSPGTYSF
jgi:hypothetical protein